MIGLNQHQAQQFAMRSGGRLQAARIHPRDFGEYLLHIVQNFQRPAPPHRAGKGAARPNPGSRAASSLILGLYFIVQDPRDKTRIYAVIFPRQVREVANYFRLGKFRQRQFAAHRIGRQQ